MSSSFVLSIIIYLVNGTIFVDDDDDDDDDDNDDYDYDYDVYD